MRLGLLIFYFYGVMALTAPAVETDRRLQLFAGRYGGAHALETRFMERYSENGRVVRVESGRAYFLRPGKMRWNYEQPERNLFLVDGKLAWFYTPADRTVTKMPARESDDLRTPLALLAGQTKLSRLCAKFITADLPDGPHEPGNSGFECALKDTTSEALRVWLELTPDGELSRILVRSAGSVQTEFRFKDWVFNPRLPGDLFRFDPPFGVVVVDGLLPTQKSGRP